MYDWISNSSFSERIDAITTDFKIVLKKCTQEMKEERNKTILLENIGITYIIECLIQCPKPIVGHNICLDLLYIYNAFIAPLPAQYSEFKMSFHTLFPIIFDTKYIASAEILKNFIPNTCKLLLSFDICKANIVFVLGLNKLHEVVLKEPFLTTKINLKQEFSGTNYHQAGYDSYLTGVCFINLIRYIYAREFTEIPDMFSNDILTQYRNKISVYRVYDIKFFNLESNDILSSRSNVFHMSFPKHWKRNDFNLIFEEFGGLTNVVFLDDENAFCILKEADNAGKVVESLIVNRKPSFPFKVTKTCLKMLNCSNFFFLRSKLMPILSKNKIKGIPFSQMKQHEQQNKNLKAKHQTVQRKSAKKRPTVKLLSKRSFIVAVDNCLKTKIIGVKRDDLFYN